MQALRVETTISKGGGLQVRGLPFRPGEKVEVIVLPLRRHQVTARASSLKNTVLKHEEPTDPVARHDSVA